MVDRSRPRFRAGLIAVGAVAIASLARLAAGDEASPSAPQTLTTGPRWWKGNLHTHSLWSDGDAFPEIVAQRYKELGYHFLVLSEHDRLQEGEQWVDVVSERLCLVRAGLPDYVARFGDDWVERRLRGGRWQVRLKTLEEYRSRLEEPDRFLLIPGEEISFDRDGKAVHVNGINLQRALPPLSGVGVRETVQANLRSVAQQRRQTGRPMLAVLNHPNAAYSVGAADMAPVAELRFVDIYNAAVRSMRGDAKHPSAELLWDTVLALRLGPLGLPLVYGVAVDDAHHYHPPALYRTLRPDVNAPQVAWVMVRSDRLAPESLIAALEAGDFYCSTGVILDEVQRDGGRLALVIRGEPGVTYTTRFIASFAESPDPAATSRPPETIAPDAAAGLVIGKVVGESQSLEPSYTFTVDELYVRASVTSSKPHPRPPYDPEFEMAWTQPMCP